MRTFHPGTAATPASAVPSRQSTSIKDLTLGQVITLLRVHGSPIAVHTINVLREGAPKDFYPSLANELCVLAMLGLVTVDRQTGTQLTNKGRAWIRGIIGD